MVAIGLGMAGCDRTPPTPPRPEPDARYITRAVIEQLPSGDNPLSEFVAHHEPIDDFKAFNGTVGMDSMSMPFPLSKSVSLDGLAIGDKVEIEFVVWSTPGHRGFEARRITKLPAETELRFGKARPLAPSTP
jgi:hypothetical protein